MRIMTLFLATTLTWRLTSQEPIGATSSHHDADGLNFAFSLSSTFPLDGPFSV